MDNCVVLKEHLPTLTFEQVEDSDWCQKWVAHIGGFSYTILSIAKVISMAVTINGVSESISNSCGKITIDTIEKAKKLCNSHYRFISSKEYK